MAIGRMIPTNQTSECPFDYILPFFLLEDSNDVYTDWIEMILKNPKRTMCEFVSGKKKCFVKPKPPKIRQTSDVASKLMNTNMYNNFGIIILMYLQFF